MDRGWSLEGRRMSMCSYWIATRSQSIFVCGFLSMTETMNLSKPAISIDFRYEN